jgi:hypothetical protein
MAAVNTLFKGGEKIASELLDDVVTKSNKQLSNWESKASRFANKTPEEVQKIKSEKLDEFITKNRGEFSERATKNILKEPNSKVNKRYFNSVSDIKDMSNEQIDLLRTPHNPETMPWSKEFHNAIEDEFIKNRKAPGLKFADDNLQMQKDSIDTLKNVNKDGKYDSDVSKTIDWFEKNNKDKLPKDFNSKEIKKQLMKNYKEEDPGKMDAFLKKAIPVTVGGGLIFSMFNRGGQMSNSELYGQSNQYGYQ